MNFQRIASRIASFGIILNGPFGRNPEKAEVKIEAKLHITGNEEFFQKLIQDGASHDDIEKLKTEGEILEIYLNPIRIHTNPEPNWTGGDEIEKYDIISVNGIELLNENDKDVILSEIKNILKQKELSFLKK